MLVSRKRSLESVLSTQSTQSKHARALRSVPGQGMALNEDMGNLEMRFSASSSNQGDGVT